MYGEAIPFHAARSRKSMPLRNATPYMVSPRCTLIVAPYFGCDTMRCGARDDEEEGVSRTTLLLHEASTRLVMKTASKDMV